MNCGLPVPPAAVAVPSPPRQAAQQEVPRQRPSVLSALLPRHMPTGAFWAGLLLVSAGLVFAFCTAATGLALMLGSSGGAEVLLVSACGLAVLIVPGLALLLAGRPRNSA